MWQRTEVSEEYRELVLQKDESAHLAGDFQRDSVPTCHRPHGKPGSNAGGMTAAFLYRKFLGCWPSIS